MENNQTPPTVEAPKPVNPNIYPNNKIPVSNSVAKHSSLFYIITGVILILLLAIIIYSAKLKENTYYTPPTISNGIPSSSPSAYSTTPITKSNASTKLATDQSEIDQTMTQINSDLNTASQKGQDTQDSNSLSGL